MRGARTTSVDSLAVPAMVQIANSGCSSRKSCSQTSLTELVAGRSCVPSEGAGADEQLIYNFQLVDQAVLDASVVITAPGPEAPQNN